MMALHGWESGVWVKRRETVIMWEMSRSNVESRRILRNGKPQDYRNQSLLIPQSILSKTGSHGRKWREGERLFGPTKYFLITLTLWNNKPFVPAVSAGRTMGGVHFLVAIKGLTSRDRIDLVKGWWKEGCGAIITFVKNKLRSSRLEGTGTYFVSSNQSNEWVESHGAGKKTFREVYTFYSKLFMVLTSAATYRRSWFAEFLFVGILTVYGHLISLHHFMLIPPAAAGVSCVQLYYSFHGIETVLHSFPIKKTNAGAFIYMLTPIIPQDKWQRLKLVFQHIFY